jgi:hypothetical protein
MHDIERELIDITGFKAKGKFADRQEYLRAILNASSKLSEDDFDALTDETAEWANSAVAAFNSKDDLPDFDESADHDPETGEVDDEDEAEDEAAEETDDEEDESSSDDEEDDHQDVDTDDEEEAEEEKPAKKSSKKATVKVPPKKPVKAEKPAKAEKAEKPEKIAPKKPAPRHDEDVVLDKFGAMSGSKNSQALHMFEKGATTKEVKDKIGGTYYNILKRAVEAGHKVTKDGAVITLTHKDAAKAAKAPVKKKK